MVKLYLEKLYRYERKDEHMGVGVPVAKGVLDSLDTVTVIDAEGNKCPIQTKVTSRYQDGSIRFFYLRFVGSLPANKGTEFSVYYDDNDLQGNADICSDEAESRFARKLAYQNQDGSIDVDTGVLSFKVKDYTNTIFDSLTYGNKAYTADSFVGPVLKDGNGDVYDTFIDSWRIEENGPLCTVLIAHGSSVSGGEGCEEGKHIKFEIKITAYAAKSYLEISHRLINTTEKELHIRSLVFSILENGMKADFRIPDTLSSLKIDSTGCAEVNVDYSTEKGPLFHTIGINNLSIIEEKTPVEDIRTCVGESNYRTDFCVGKGISVSKVIDANKLLYQSNEHIPEAFYGTFFADRTDEAGGVCATVFQAHQNYPKAVCADKSGIYVHIVPEGVDKVVMQSGMSREQRFMLHFHEAQVSLVEIDNRSLIYQMPDRPMIISEEYAKAGIISQVYTDTPYNVEMHIIAKADAHMRCYGMMNWGDAIDANYTAQGRGGGKPVWSNNEYDFPHACAQLYYQTGVRRFMDYCLVNASHWMDVDVCHYSGDPLVLNAQIEHTMGHTVNGIAVPSHQWVEGLLDYYHLTGDRRAFDTAQGIGENLLRLLETDTYKKPGEMNARETGWALRSLTALYVETGDTKWIAKCEWIVGHFIQWRDEYGAFVALYTDNTLVRTGFMISVAAGSLMRYYREFPTEELKELIMSTVDDVYDNCRLHCGLFYYKELPSLTRLGNNTMLLECMAIGYELSGDKKYLEAGMRTFERTVQSSPGYNMATKKIIDDTVAVGTESTKSFAQGYYPISFFCKCAVDAGLI